MKTKTVRQERLDDLKFYLMPRDGGQIVVDTYAVDEQGVWLKQFDQGDRSTEYFFAKYDERRRQYEFEPWNNILPAHCQWQRVVVQ